MEHATKHAWHVNEIASSTRASELEPATKSFKNQQRGNIIRLQFFTVYIFWQ